MTNAEHPATKAAALMDEGRTHLDEGRQPEAESCFRAAAAAFPTAHALNNWALCRYLAGDHAGALEILAPVLAEPDPATFTRALASLARSARGEREEARRLLQGAIRDFDRGLHSASARGGIPEPAWIEYTSIIKQAAGELGEHRLVLELHGRWPGREHPQGAFAAGVAAFNLRKFEQAAKYWSRITAPDWAGVMEAYERVAALAGEGLVPPFPLEYDPDPQWPENDKRPETAGATAARGSARMRILAAIFDPGFPEATTGLSGLIAVTGDWGIDLGRRLLKASAVPMTLKMAAARALTDQGVFKPGAEIPIVHQGRPDAMVLRSMELLQGPHPELDRRVAEAIRLRDAGRKEEAYRMLAAMEAEGIAYPPAMSTLANLMRERGELEAARSTLEVLEEAMPEHPGVLFNLAGLSMQLGNVDRARDYARRIDPKGQPPAFQTQVARLRAALGESGLITAAPTPAQVGDAVREEAEEKPISLNLTLSAALKGIPVPWLNAAAAAHGIRPARLRRDREKALAAALLDPAQARQALADMQPEARAALRFVLESGGWAKVQALTRRFGAMDGDGYWWDEEPPSSPVGRLRALGLLFVGRATVDGKRHKVAVVPAELRAVLGGVL